MVCVGTPPIHNRTTSYYIYVYYIYIVVVDGHLCIECGWWLCCSSDCCLRLLINDKLFYLAFTLSDGTIVSYENERMRPASHTHTHTPFLINRAAAMTWWWWLEAIKMVPANRIRTQRRFTKIYNESPFLRFVCHILAICAPTERTRKWKTITAIVFFFLLVRSQHSFLVGLIKSSANNNNGSAH